MNDILKTLEKLDSEIEDDLKELITLNSLKDSIKTQISNEEAEIQKQKFLLTKNIVDQENLAVRKEEIHRKFSVLDVVVKNDADKITEETKKLMKALHVKTSVEQCPNSSFLEFKVEFNSNIGCATFLYDPNTEDFELSSLNPPHKNFQTMKDFIRSTGDVNGFLSNYFKYCNSNHPNI